MRIIWDDQENRFLAELTPGEQWRQDMEAVKAAGFRTTGPPAWQWYAGTVETLENIRENPPKSGLLITEQALEKYKPLLEKFQQKQELRKQFKQAQKTAKKQSKDSEISGLTELIIPEKGYIDASDLQPEFGLVQGEGTSANQLFTDNDVVGALEKTAADGASLQNIRSVAGFERRLNDITCSGCHQTRGIGGFHFPGVDWMAVKPSNSTVVPASPHFFGDQIRRRDILTSLRDGTPPDYSRGFSNRPQLRGSTELAGTEYDDGWGAHCYAQRPNAADNDRSFKSWTCAEGLACQVAGQGSRMGMCFVRDR